MKFSIFLIVLSATSLPLIAQAQVDRDDPEFVAARISCVNGEDAKEYNNYTLADRIEACTVWSGYEGEREGAIYFRALLNNKAGNSDAAYDDFSESLQFDKGNPSAWHSRGVINLYDRGNTDEGIADLTEAINLRLDEPRAYYFYNRGQGYVIAAADGVEDGNYDIGLLELARVDLQTFLDLSPEDPLRDAKRRAQVARLLGLIEESTETRRRND